MEAAPKGTNCALQANVECPLTSPFSIVFSCWTKMLDLIQKALQKDNIGFRRIDGQTTLKGRENALEAFRNDPNCQVMLASIGSVAEG